MDPLMATGGDLLIFSRKPIQIKSILEAEPVIIIAFPFDLVYNKVDRDHIIRGIYLSPINKYTGDRLEASPFPIYDAGGREVGTIAIQHVSPDRETDIAGWEMWDGDTAAFAWRLRYCYLLRISGGPIRGDQESHQAGPVEGYSAANCRDAKASELSDILDLIERPG
jgi:hypothetical protein